MIGVDPYWCTPDPAFSNWQPFPFFLYDLSPWRYLAGLLSDQTFDAALQRALYALGLGRRRRARPDGYWNYEDHRVWRADVNGPALARAEPWGIANESGRFPQIDALARRLASLAIPVVLVRPPAYVTIWPQAGTPLAAADAACGEAIRRLAVARPRTALVDWRSDRPENRDPANFLDGTHYRAAVARALEREVAAALARLGAGSR